MISKMYNRKGVTKSLFPLLILVLCFISSIAGAKVIHSDQVEVLMDSYQTLELNGKKDGVLEINVKVIEGEAVDVFLMNETNFFIYTSDDPFEYYEKGSALNIKQKKWTFKAPEDATYYLVLDNTEKGEAYPKSDLEVKVVVSDVTSTPFSGALETGIAVILTFILVILFGAERKIKGE